MKIKTLALLVGAALLLQACATTEADTTVSGDMYRVKDGESLFIIAEREYGSKDEWVVLYDANKEVIGENPHMIFPGQMIVIPEMK